MVRDLDIAALETEEVYTGAVEDTGVVTRGADTGAVAVFDGSCTPVLVDSTALVSGT